MAFRIRVTVRVLEGLMAFEVRMIRVYEGLMVFRVRVMIRVLEGVTAF